MTVASVEERRPPVSLPWSSTDHFVKRTSLHRCLAERWRVTGQRMLGFLSQREDYVFAQ